MKKLFFIWMICLLNTGAAFAQWTEEDSVWLKNVLSGKEKLELNPETKKAIESGTFINPEGQKQPLLTSPSEYPILKEFEDIDPSTQDSARKRIDYQSMTPAQFRLYFMSDSLFLYDLQSFYISPAEREYLQAITPGGILTFSAEDILRTIFWPSHRAKMRNRKHATAWKWYNLY